MFISILIPVYNCSEFILKALDSIPVRSDIELIIANDCSTDDSFSVIYNYKTKNKIKLLNFKTNHGIGYIRNKLIEYSSGEWICWLDGDDYFYTNKIDQIFNKLYKLNAYDYIQLKARKNNGIISSGGCECWHKIFKRKIYDIIKFGDYRRAEDWFFMQEFKLHKFKEYNYSEVCYHYNFPRKDSLSYIWKLTRGKNNEIHNNVRW